MKTLENGNKTDSLMLRVILTGEEKIELSRQAADTQLEIDQLEENLSSFKKTVTGDIEAKTMQLRGCLGRVRDGYEIRPVECSIEMHTPKKGMATIIRLDTGEVVKERQMSQDELQAVLDFEGASA